MERQEFCDRVLAKVRHATPKEKTAIRAELDAHMEDHAAALLEAGYEEAEAAERAMYAMGDPEEIGAELNKDYPLGWLVLSRVSLILTVLICATFLFSWPKLGNTLNSLQARIAPETSGFASTAKYTYERDLDIRAEIGGDILRIYKVGLDVNRDGETGNAALFFCNYSKNPFGYTADLMYLECGTSGIMESARNYDCGWCSGNAGAYYSLVAKIPVTRTDNAVVLTDDHFGKYVRLEVSVPWEDVT
ncbi:hypothetical protein OBV_33910 [Oscillibacter valericigenes Sjm18-20]|nr:hypothetical protein OBV_33910 [Oscillibacter valericigenes Sjm18-20]